MRTRVDPASPEVPLQLRCFRPSRCWLRGLMGGNIAGDLFAQGSVPDGASAAVVRTSRRVQKRPLILLKFTAKRGESYES